MIVRLGLVVCVLGIMSLTGCQDATKTDASTERLKEMSGEKELRETVPVSGKVSIDGKPEAGVNIYLYSLDGKGPIATTRTGEGGTYTWSTYIAGDGLEAGTYRLAFDYIPKQKKNDEGVDALKGKFRNPMKNEFQLKILKGFPMTKADYDLVTK